MLSFHTRFLSHGFQARRSCSSKDSHGSYKTPLPQIAEQADGSGENDTTRCQTSSTKKSASTASSTSNQERPITTPAIVQPPRKKKKACSVTKWLSACLVITTALLFLSVCALLRFVLIVQIVTKPVLESSEISTALEGDITSEFISVQVPFEYAKHFDANKFKTSEPETWMEINCKKVEDYNLDCISKRKITPAPHLKTETCDADLWRQISLSC